MNDEIEWVEIDIELTEAEIELLNELAERHGITPGEMLSKVLTEYLEQNKDV